MFIARRAFEKLQHREVANINYVQNSTNNSDFTQIVDPDSSSSASISYINVISNAFILQADTTATIFKHC